jgi:uncharacterized iron-regulated membrane protein
MTPRQTPPAPAARRITPSELGTFTFCQRAWFLENEGEPSALTDARDRGATNHATRASAVLQGQKTARGARLLLMLGLLALLCAVILGWLNR